MNQLIDVATWVGLIAALLGISLAIVAIWFTFSTESRSRRVSDQMIKSLQKIEMFVERSSADTQELIKVGWDRMLVNMGDSSDRSSDQTPASAVKQMAEGLAQEIRAELNLEPVQKTPAESIDEDRIIKRVSESVQAQLQISQRRNRTRLSERVEDWLRVLSTLSPMAYELMRTICRNSHLTRGEYFRLISLGSTYRSAIRELRNAGMLVPLLSDKASEENQPVYWLPPGEAESIRVAFEFAPRREGEMREEAIASLREVGYLGKPKPVEKRKSISEPSRDATSDGGSAVADANGSHASDV